MEYTRFVGWDVHAATIAVAVAEVGRDPAQFEGALPATADAVRQWVRRQPDAATLLVCYEAGPTGFEMARLLTELGVTCRVVAPGLVPKKPTDRIKTDRRDTIKLAQALRAGSLTPVRIPTRSDEAFRDLIRTRTQAVEDHSRVRHRVKSAVLRWGVRVPGTSRTWSRTYVAWIRHWTPDEVPRRVAGTAQSVGRGRCPRAATHRGHRGRVARPSTGGPDARAPSVTRD